jgi:23S rRNA (cytidine1920-2'-O)/16S rRNA (cytidine1409-2'-O)-methyltransferase
MATEKKEKMRLDQLLVARGHFESLEQAQAHILAGEVWSGQSRLDKSGAKVHTDIPIDVKSTQLKYVSRAGFKLEHALETFAIDVRNLVCLDVGASTGGFTDCLLQRGASHVFAVDVGTGQLHHRIRQHPQVTSLEQTNAKELGSNSLRSADGKFSNQNIGLVCADVSFISLSKILPSLKLAAPRANFWILLFKPQFEVDRENIEKGGVVRSETAIGQSLDEFIRFAATHGLHLRAAPSESPLAGKKSGNVERLLFFGTPT